MGHRLDGLQGRSRIAVAEVVGQGGGEQIALLGNQGHQLPQGPQLQAGDVDSVDPQLAWIHIHHAADGPGQGGLATAHRAHHGHQLARFHPKTHIHQRRPRRAVVAHRQPPGLDGAAGGLGRGLRHRRRQDQGLAVEQFLHPLQAHLAGLEGVEGEAEQGGGKHQPLHEQDQRHQVADAEATALELAAAQGQQQ